MTCGLKIFATLDWNYINYIHNLHWSNALSRNWKLIFLHKVYFIGLTPDHGFKVKVAGPCGVLHFQSFFRLNWIASFFVTPRGPAFWILLPKELDFFIQSISRKMLTTHPEQIEQSYKRHLILKFILNLLTMNYLILDHKKYRCYILI